MTEEDNKLVSSLAECNALRAKMLGTPLATTAPSSQVRSSSRATSSGSYYKKHYAREVQITVDKMLEDGQDCQYSYSDFPHLKHSALYLRISQSLLYLVRNLDTPEFKYTIFRKRIEVTREKTGVCLRFKKNHIPILATEVAAREDSLKWKEAVENIIETGNYNTQYRIGKLQLSSEEVLELRLSLVELPEIIANITQSEITIVKLKKSSISNDA